MAVLVELYAPIGAAITLPMPLGTERRVVVLEAGRALPILLLLGGLEDEDEEDDSALIVGVRERQFGRDFRISESMRLFIRVTVCGNRVLSFLSRDSIAGREHFVSVKRR